MIAGLQPPSRPDGPLWDPDDPIGDEGGPDAPDDPWEDAPDLELASVAYLPGAEAVRERTRVTVADEGEQEQERPGRRVDLKPFLDGTYVAPVPSVGAFRADGRQMLYESRWHTAIALTGAGKSWFGLVHAVQVMATGKPVVYSHFEEASPQGTIGRLRQMAVTDDAILKHFVWVDSSMRWKPGAFAAELGTLDTPPGLVVLDGINSACAMHGWIVDKSDAVGEYRREFVTPCTRAGAAVLSLGHPPKARDRQGERHSYGASGWLDEVDGVSFKLESSRTAPIRRKHVGYTSIFVVKDRYGQVDEHAEVSPDREAGWFTYASMRIDDTGEFAEISLTMPEPKPAADDLVMDKVAQLADVILDFLTRNGGTCPTIRHLRDSLRAENLSYRNSDVEPALIRLEQNGQIVRGPADGRGTRSIGLKPWRPVPE